MSDPSKLSGKRALVTAGAQGIGLAIQPAPAGGGLRSIFVHYRSSAEAAQALSREASALGRRCGTTGADLTETEECERVVAEAVLFPRRDSTSSVNNAGSMVCPGAVWPRPATNSGRK